MTKRQRHVFPNREIPHLWAHQTQGEARNGTGNFYFRGATIYSYGSHFPIATHVTGSQRQAGILFTSRKNSVTTSQHMSAVSRSNPPDVPVFTVPHLQKTHDYGPNGPNWKSGKWLMYNRLSEGGTGPVAQPWLPDNSRTMAPTKFLASPNSIRVLSR